MLANVQKNDSGISISQSPATAGNKI